jgi:hypothetical protein
MSDSDTISCSVAPTVVDVAVNDMAGTSVTSLDGLELALIVWNTTGEIETVSIILERADDTTALPIPIATHIVNSGEYLWEPSPTIASGTYYVRIEYGSDISGRSTSMSKTTSTSSLCPSVDCNGHGQCDEDTNSTCVCRYGWGGTTCDMAPLDITYITASVIVDTPYSVVQSSPTVFNALFRTDMASALLVLSDQIEVTALSMGSTASQTRVDFRVLMGSAFHKSPFDFNSTSTLTTTLQTMLSSSDSTLNRGVIEFSSVVKEDSSKPSLSAAFSTSTPAVTAVIALIAVSVAALF